MKTNLKLSLIDDYVQIVLIENFCKNKISTICSNLSTNIHKIQKHCSLLKSFYEKVINLLKLNNVSFLVLQKQLSLNNTLYEKEKLNNFLNTHKIINQFEETLNTISKNIKQKLTKLKLNNSITTII